MSTLRAGWAHMRALWPRYTLLPGAPFVLWPIFTFFADGVRWEMVVLLLIGAFLPYIGAKSKDLYIGAAPACLVAVLYDAMRFVKNVGLSPARVHVCDLRATEIRYFGITMNGERTTVHDWFQAHHHPALDLGFAVPYATFLGVVAVLTIYLYFRDVPAQRRFTLGFLALNVAGFATYHLYPAAPPWYYHAHGCVADLATKASEGANLARVDATLGISYFASFYKRSNDVFGAMPSLHVAYPLLIVLEGWKSFGVFLRAFSIVFWLSMCVAAVYLDHHWISDVVAGLTYTLIVFFAVRALWARHEKRAGARAPAPPTEWVGA